MKRILESSKKWTVLILVLLPWSKLEGQTGERDLQGTFDTWWSNLNKYSFSKKWYATSEVHIRRANGVAHWRQFLLRPGINHVIRESTHLSAGYSFIRSYPFREKNRKAGLVIEHNIWEQVLLKGGGEHMNYNHRYRIEQRFIEVPMIKESGEVHYSQVQKQRFRYRFTASISLPSAERLSIDLFDELWVNLFNDLAPIDLDKNWLYAGLGYDLSKTTKVGLGYVNHWSPLGGNSYENTHIVQTTLFWDLDLGS